MLVWRFDILKIDMMSWDNSIFNIFDISVLIEGLGANLGENIV